LGKSVHLSRLGKKQISGFGLPPISVTKNQIKKETFEKSEETCGFLDFFTFQKYFGTAIKTINNW